MPRPAAHSRRVVALLSLSAAFLAPPKRVERELDVDAAEPGDACIETAGVVARDGALPGRRSPERPHESELPAATTRAIRELSRKSV